AGGQNAVSAMVYGAGPVGLMHARLLKHYGVEKVGVADVSEYRLSLALGMGADFVFDPTKPETRERALKNFPAGPELVVIATASMAALEEGLGVVGRAGTVLLFGAPRRGASAQLDAARLFLNGTRLVTSYGAYETETAEAMKLLAHGKVRVSDMITHRFPLEQAGDAFTIASQQRAMKALVLD
ncbi:MAG: zinc-binding dehydrogenase, partial [Thaumarchaeota archaeon]|nr:zinc-binding dehydrogenase [Nitrososphaerota archaeon]